MRRREFVGLVGGAAAWPAAARAQQPERVRRVGVLMNVSGDHPEAGPRLSALRERLRELGWADGHNVKIEVRWGGTDVALYRQYAAELIALAPDVIVGGGLGVRELQRVTSSVPIVFAGITDPVTAGFVASLARPGGNMTGFESTEYGFSAKWLELLKQIAPVVTRAGILRDSNLNGDQQFAAIQAAAPLLGLEELSAIVMVDADQIERAVSAFADKPNGGLVLRECPGRC
jgi:putative ABC transport system substrate-binding protein